MPGESCPLANDLKPALAELRDLIAALQPGPLAAGEERLIQAAIDRLRLAGVRSSVLKLDRDLVVRFCRRVLDPTASDEAAWKWLRAAGGRDISRSSCHRFTRQFRWALDSLLMSQPLGEALAQRRSSARRGSRSRRAGREAQRDNRL